MDKVKEMRLFKDMHTHGGDIYNNKEVIDFSANINFSGIPQKIQEAAIQGILESTNYPDVECRELRDGLGKEYGLPSSYFICGNGAADVIFSLVLACKPKKALLLAPTFYEYEQALRSVDCEILYEYLKEETKFQLQSSYLDRIKEDVDILFLCNPNNPTGVVVEKEYLLQIMEACKKQGVLFVLDECFNDFLEQPERYSLKTEIKEENPHLFILKAFTKMYAIPGLRLGYGITSSQKINQKIKEVTQPWNVSVPAQMAGIAALKEKEYVHITKEKLKVEKAYLKKGMKELGYTLYASKANYIFFKGQENLKEQLLTQGILIRDCCNYEGLEKGYFRIGVKGHIDNEKFLHSLRKVKG